MSYLKYKADFLFTGNTMLNHEYVLIAQKNGTIETIVPATAVNDADVRYVEGIICPGFVNCHCHTELSHLLGSIEQGTGLVNFILAILQQRNSNTNTIHEATTNAIAAMQKNGIVAVGDICNTTDSLLAKQNSPLYFHNFIEVSGFNPAFAANRFEQIEPTFNQYRTAFAHQTSLVPHAPYSTSLALLQKINTTNTNVLSSIHMQEAADENLFFYNGNGSFNKLYQQLQIAINGFHTPKGNSSLQYFLPHYTQPQKIILVHNTFTNEEDVIWLQKNAGIKQYFHCLCVNANSYIEQVMPPIDLLMQHQCKVVIGTDSLASNHQLSVLAELQTIQRHFTNIPTATLLQWATINGAQALGIAATVGSFNTSKKPGIVYINHINSNGSLTHLSTATVLL